MARINIEDCWWTDPRRALLIKNLNSDMEADATIIRAWRLAQEFWKTNKGLVPIELFETLPNHEKIIESKLAVVREGFVYVRGSSAYLDWLREQREIGKANGSKGGQASVKARKEKYGSAIPLGASNQKSEAKPNPSVSGSISDSLVVVEETTTTNFPEKKKPNSSESFDARFSLDAQKLTEFFNSQTILKDLKIYVPQIIYRWTTFELFMIFYDGILGSKNFPKDKPGRKRYLMAALTSEIDQSRKAAQ